MDELLRHFSTGGVLVRTLSERPLVLAPVLDAHNLHRLVRVLVRLEARDPGDPAWRPRVALGDLDRTVRTRHGEVELRMLHGLPRRTERLRSPLADPASTVACTDAFGPAARLVVRERVIAEPGYRHRVLRCALQGAPGAPRTAIVKSANEGVCVGEHASLSFLGALPSARGVVPALLGADPRRAVLLLEDLGEVRGSDLAMILLGTDRERAERLLVGQAAALGRLHRASLGRERTWEALLGRAERRSFACDELGGALFQLEGALASQGLEVGLADELDVLTAELGASGPWRAWTRGDPGTTNTALVRNRVRLFDLEMGGFRHVMVDACFAVAHHAALYAGTVPSEVWRRVEDAWRDVVRDRLPEVDDREVFERARAVGAIGWSAGLVQRLLPGCAEDAHRGGRPHRSRLRSALTATIALSGARRHFPGAIAALEALAERLGERYGAEPRLPLHPVFEQGSSPPR